MTNQNPTQKQQNRPGQQGQQEQAGRESGTSGKNKTSERPQSMPGSHGVESPGRDELKRTKPGEELGQQEEVNGMPSKKGQGDGTQQNEQPTSGRRGEDMSSKQRGE